MADGSGGNAMLGLIVGGVLVVVVLIFAFGGFPGMQRSADVNITPKITTPAK
jgi:hypothetical protein